MKISLSSFPLLRALAVLVLMVIGYELGGIWLELKGIRSEQVKNAVYSMNPDNITRIRNGPNGALRLRHLAGQNSIVADDTLPVEIQP